MNRGLIEVLRQWADDPMWADHAEVPKIVLRKAADRIAALEAEASENARLLGQAGEKIANLSGEIDRLKRDLARVEAEASEGERRGLGEPIAWRWREKGSRTWQLADVPPDRSDYWHNEIVPLYAASISEAPTQRELGSSAENQISTAEFGFPEALARER